MSENFERPGENPLGRNPFNQADAEQQPRQGADAAQTPDVVDATHLDPQGEHQQGEHQQWEHQQDAAQHGGGHQGAQNQTAQQPVQHEAPRHAAGTPAAAASAADQPAADQPATDQAATGQPAAEPRREQQLEALVAERTGDLQRLQAEYVNYKKRVDRDRALSRQQGAGQVVADLLPIMDSIELARQHGDMNDGFQMVADSLEALATKHGLVRFGEVGDLFDPVLHEALMEQPAAEPVDQTTVTMVMQKGYKLGDRVLRPARVGVANPS